MSRRGQPLARAHRGALAALAGLWLPAGCSDAGREAPKKSVSAPVVDVPVPAPTPTRIGRPAFSLDGLEDAPLCSDTGAAPAPREPIAIRLISGPGVAAHDTQVVGETMRTVWKRLGQPLHVAGPDQLPSTAPSRLFDPSGTTEQAQLAPMRAVLAAIPSGAAIPVVVMPRFVDTPSKLAAFRGLTVPAAGAPNHDPSVSTAFLEANPNPHPVVFVNLAAGPRAPGDLSLSPAHELGHALGLRHQTADAVLMSDGDLSLRCLPGLSLDEWSQLAASGAGPATAPHKP